MKRQYSTAFDTVEEDFKETGKKMGKRSQSFLCSDTLGIVASCLAIDDCSRMRQVSKYWNSAIMEHIKQNKYNLRIFGKCIDSIQDKAYREVILGLSKFHTIRNVFPLNILPDFFDSVIIDSITISEMNILFDNYSRDVKELIIMNSFAKDEIIEKISASRVERLTLFNIEGIKTPKISAFTSLRSFVSSDLDIPSRLKDDIFVKLINSDIADGFIGNITFIPKNPQIASFVGQDICQLERIPHSTKSLNIRIADDNYNDTPMQLFDSKHAPNLEELIIDCYGIDTSELNNDLSIRKLVIKRCRLNAERLFYMLSKCPQLKQLCLLDCSVLDEVKNTENLIHLKKNELFNGCTVSIPQGVKGSEKFTEFLKVFKSFKFNGCKLESVVIDRCELSDIFMGVLLNCSITDRLKTLSITRGRLKSKIVLERKFFDLTTILLESECLSSLTNLITDTTLVFYKSLRKKSKNSDVHLLLNPPNMPKLKHLTIDLSLEPVKACSLAIKGSKMDRIGIETLCVCLHSSDFHFLTLSNMIPSLCVLSDRQETKIEYDSYSSED